MVVGGRRCSVNLATGVRIGIVMLKLFPRCSLLSEVWFYN
jgi:hypothetical protein